MSHDPVARARARLALQFALLCAALLVASGGGVYFYVRHVLDAAFDAAHDLAVRSVLETVDVAPLTVKEAEFVEEFEELKGTLGVVAASVWSPDGRRLVGEGLAIGAEGPPREFSGSGSSTVRIRREPVTTTHGTGVVVVARQATDLAQDLAALRRALLLFLPLALLGSLVAGWIMAGRSLRPVRRAIEQQRAFMAEASHEIRTPLSILRAHAEVPLQGDADPAAMKASLDVIARTSARLGELVDDLLYLARSDAASLAPRRVSFDVEEWIEECVEAFGPLAAAKGSRLVIRTREPLAMSADPSQLTRLLGLLVDNALKHGIPGEIEVSCERRGRYVELCVSDAGPGIPEEMLPRVFERFVRGAAAREGGSEGHGLGLAIGRSIVQAHGGTLGVQRNARGGTTAIARLLV